METYSILLARFWGWLTLTMSLIYFLRPALLREVKSLMVENRTFSILYGLASVILGVGSVVLHNQWSIGRGTHVDDAGWRFAWPVAVTVFGWACLLKGVVVLGWPDLARRPRFETRLASTRIALLVACLFSAWLLVASRGP